MAQYIGQAAINLSINSGTNDWSLFDIIEVTPSPNLNFRNSEFSVLTHVKT